AVCRRSLRCTARPDGSAAHRNRARRGARDRPPCGPPPARCQENLSILAATPATTPMARGEKEQLTWRMARRRTVQLPGGIVTERAGASLRHGGKAASAKVRRGAAPV